MISKSFRVNIVLRLAGLFLVGTGMLYILLQTPFWMLSVWLFLILLLGFFELIKYIERNYRILGNFLMGIQQNDFSYAGKFHKNVMDKQLGKAFHHVAELVENLRLDAETNYQYLQTVVNHVDVGILCFDKTGKVNLVNKSARDFLGLPNMRSLDSLRKIDTGFYELILNLNPGERKLYKIDLNGRNYQLALRATFFRKEHTNYKLVSFQNIKGELEMKEMESWYKLTRVLTHEIMNSAIPISNLTAMIYETVLDGEQQFRDLKELDPENQEELITSLQTIQNRSRGLVDFVNSTRRITRLPQPRIHEINIVEVISRVFSLFSQKLKQRNIQYKIKSVGEKMLLHGDAEQLERVFINLLQNAIEALDGREDPKITVKLDKHSRNKTTISVMDNGKGMTPEESESLFIPFYTTKKEGTGIGLTLSRQIIHNHNGEINVESMDGGGTKCIVTI